MTLFGAIGFLAPTLLLALLALPILWWLLRAVPPAAIKRRFPAVTLLLGLKDPESTPDKTPWWLLLLRMLALAAIITGFAGPILNPKEARLATGPLLILTDASWASAPDWARRQDKIDTLLQEAARLGRPAVVIPLTNPPNITAELPWRGARDWAEEVAGLAPNPWEPDYAAFTATLNGLANADFETVWLSDGLKREGRAALAEKLDKIGNLSVVQTVNATLAISPPLYRDGIIVAKLLRSRAGPEQSATLVAIGPDPAGIERKLAQIEAVFPAGSQEIEVEFDLPAELRNRIRRFAISGKRSAGAVSLADDALKRRKVVLFAGQNPREGQELVSSLHFLRKALAPTAELIEAPVRQSLLADPDVVILADVAKMTSTETEALRKWVEAGGLLVRFAGPKLAAASLSQIEDDPLLPVRLRAGGRNVGGAMSWGSPKLLQPFAKGSPFFGLTIPDDVSVTSQVIAQPDPFLAERTIASLQDGTPLVTRKDLGEGRVVLVHVTANAEWSNLPLSGLFVQMLERLAVSTRTAAPSKADLAGQLWQPKQVMNGFGDLRSADDLIAVEGERLAGGNVARDLPPGTYVNGDREIAINVITPDRQLAAAVWPAGLTVSPMQTVAEKPLKALLLAAALILLMVDLLATMWLGGRLRGPREGVITSALVALFLLSPGFAPQARAQDARALQATAETVLAYVKTGDARLDAASEAGLYGLSVTLTKRTAIEPNDPIAIDLETDELAFFPLIYWPITESQPIPSQEAYDRLNDYLRTGGMILFDTRDANLGGLGAGTPNGRRLQQLAASLNIPALEPIPSDHVLTRSFYLLQDFPGRYARSDVWVEAAPADATRIEGMPFRNLNDGVSPVVIGGNDWAAAWAQSRDGQYLFPVGRGGYGGERQRELAYRFGVNLVMYVLTGNYKSDQVHVPALLERLGQ
ncbi:MAG: DUF4159 domain-containing protein [Alphaproteobacteria bacterium]|nr:DUF4159 domain-containing protein [Alphaproteobacteria bacterium]